MCSYTGEYSEGLRTRLKGYGRLGYFKKAHGHETMDIPDSEMVVN